MVKFGICFSKEFKGNKPLSHVGKKLPTYIKFLKLCQRQNWEVYVLTRREYKGKGIFAKSWLFKNDKFEQFIKPVKIDIIYDKTGGMNFPLEKDRSVIFVDQRNFKKLCWDKYLAYKKFKKYMPETYLINDKKGLKSKLSKIKTSKVVLKPTNGLGGKGIFIGSKKEALKFNFHKKYKKYIAQEFLDTSCGIPGLVKGMHDIRVVVLNKKIVWSHVRTPRKGEFLSSVAQGGDIAEIKISEIPLSIQSITKQISKSIYKNYDNPVFSLDFGMTSAGPKIFEINDQIGFPTWEMQIRDDFLEELIKNFASKLAKLIT